MVSEFIASYDSWADFARFCLWVDDFMCGDVYRYPSLTMRQPRDRLNPMELYSDDEFSFRYRFSKVAVMKMLEELCMRENSDRRGAPLPPLLKLLIALRFHGSGAMQTVVGDLVNVSQPTVSNVLWEVTQAVCLRLCPKYVQLPNATEGKSLMMRFYQIGRFPGVSGCIDYARTDNQPGRRLRRSLPQPEGNLMYSLYIFVNSLSEEDISLPKNCFLQAVTGPELQFLDVVASWPGSVHDSRIFENSRVIAMYEASSVPGVLLGDQGYPCLPFLMTPLRVSRTSAEKRQARFHLHWLFGMNTCIWFEYKHQIGHSQYLGVRCN
ncbi:hypothetical protein HPB48_001629 [Haemaphysalis longicornis]|uniref:DDE Tnp4 domain-containing protein n=1 Tax=Haemaphysalis longicornis TaxID=44386 RepID=A0A9J6FYW5_HAELO|nr:hypothetical protein HPB48_001629 [Haemaphysalis longicornis]